MTDDPAVIDDDQESPAKYLTVIVTQQPADVATVIGSDISFTVNFSAVIPAQISLVWQCSLNNFNGTTAPADVFIDLVETPGVYEGTATKTLTVKSVDNFLCAFKAKFRCKILFAGSVPTFTNSATVTAAGALNWSGGSGQYDQPGIYIFSFGVLGGVISVFPFPEVPLDLVAFPGPYTYQWTRVSGAAFTCASPTDESPEIVGSGLSVGFHFSGWTCRISNGILTTTSDPIYLGGYIFPLADPDGTAYNVVPILTTNGRAFQNVSPVPPPVIPFNAPWTIAFTQRQRAPAAPTVSIDNNASASTTFSLSGAYPGGTAVCAFVSFLTTGDDGLKYLASGNVGWTGQL